MISNPKEDMAGYNLMEIPVTNNMHELAAFWGCCQRDVIPITGYMCDELMRCTSCLSYVLFIKGAFYRIIGLCA